MFLRGAVFVFWAAPGAHALQQSSFPGETLHQLGWDSHGRLSFLQTGVQHGHGVSPWTIHKELYPVEISFDLQEMDAAKGVSMMFDGQRRLMRLERGLAPKAALAWGWFDDQITKTGWSELVIQTATSSGVANDVKTYSAGYVEGVVSCVRISDFNANTHQLLARGERTSSSAAGGRGAQALAGVKALFRSQLDFLKAQANIREHIVAQEPESSYWRQGRYLLFQLWGLADGYNAAARRFGAQPLGLEDLLLLNSGAELPQLLQAYSPDATEHRVLTQSALSFLQRAPLSKAAINSTDPTGKEDPLDDAHWERRLEQSGRCSALVRASDGHQDLFVGHTTWDDYSKMTRIFKYYKFNLPNAETVATDIAFSSYPGVISSTDDFYITSSGLVATETSIEVLDPSVWDKVRDEQVHPRIPSFVHTMITNRLAESASHWVQLFSKGDCGVCTSQWMIVDYNVFQVGSPIPDNTLWVLEVVPGTMQMKDMSYFLRSRGYWPSFNRPFFSEIRQVTGHAGAEESHASLYSWTSNPRAKIFASAAANVNGLFDMRKLMSQNTYPRPGTGAGPGHEISARMDLSQVQPVPNGGIDSKVVSRCLVAQLQAQAVSGPSHGQQQVFRWRSRDGTELWPGWPHIGMPDVWNFGFVQFSLSGFKELDDAAAC